MITIERLKQLLEYNPETGLWTWRVHRHCKKCGDIAGGLNSAGYIQITIDGTKYLAHRLAWLYMTGEWPKSLIDHEDLKPINNVWTNLREATHSQNKANRYHQKNNSCGVKGVDFHQGKWRSLIYVDGAQIYLGSYPTKEQAADAYKIAAIKHFGDFARYENV
jgi:hypothetical protein